MSTPTRDEIELGVYRVITPPWLYFALLDEYRRLHGSPYPIVEAILKQIPKENL